MGCPSFRFTASTPAMAVVATAPSPGMSTARRSPLRWGRMLSFDMSISSVCGAGVAEARRLGNGVAVPLDPRARAVNPARARGAARRTSGHPPAEVPGADLRRGDRPQLGHGRLAGRRHALERLLAAERLAAVEALVDGRAIAHL